MSLAHGSVRERGTWRLGALCAATALAFASVMPARASAAPRPPASHRVPKLYTVTPAKPKKKKPRTVKGMIRHEFGKHADDALRVAHCESKLDPKAYNRGAVGVFQILRSAHDWRVDAVDGRDLYDARTNVRVARHLFEDQGWGPWTCADIVGVSA